MCKTIPFPLGIIIYKLIHLIIGQTWGYEKNLWLHVVEWSCINLVTHFYFKGRLKVDDLFNSKQTGGLVCSNCRVTGDLQFCVFTYLGFLCSYLLQCDIIDIHIPRLKYSACKTLWNISLLSTDSHVYMNGHQVACDVWCANIYSEAFGK